MRNWFFLKMIPANDPPGGDEGGPQYPSDSSVPAIPDAEAGAGTDTTVGPAAALVAGASVGLGAGGGSGSGEAGTAEVEPELEPELDPEDELAMVERQLSGCESVEEACDDLKEKIKQAQLAHGVENPNPDEEDIPRDYREGVHANLKKFGLCGESEACPNLGEIKKRASKKKEELQKKQAELQEKVAQKKLAEAQAAQQKQQVNVGKPTPDEFNDKEPTVEKHPGKIPIEQTPTGEGWQLLIDALGASAKQAVNQADWAHKMIRHKIHKNWNGKREEYNEKQELKFGDSGFKYTKDPAKFNVEKKDRVKELGEKAGKHKELAASFEDGSGKLKAGLSTEEKAVHAAAQKVEKAANAAKEKLGAIKDLPSVEAQVKAAKDGAEGVIGNVVSAVSPIPLRDKMLEASMQQKVDEINADDGPAAALAELHEAEEELKKAQEALEESKKAKASAGTADPAAPAADDASSIASIETEAAAVPSPAIPAVLPPAPDAVDEYAPPSLAAETAATPGLAADVPAATSPLMPSAGSVFDSPEAPSGASMSVEAYLDEVKKYMDEKGVKLEVKDGELSVCLAEGGAHPEGPDMNLPLKEAMLGGHAAARVTELDHACDSTFPRIDELKAGVDAYKGANTEAKPAAKAALEEKLSDVKKAVDAKVSPPEPTSPKVPGCS